MKRLNAFVVALLLAACRSSMPVLTGPPDVVGDAADGCHLCCAKLETNHCGTIAEPWCTKNCENDQAQGVATQLDPGACLGAATLEQLSTVAGVPCTGATP